MSNINLAVVSLWAEDVLTTAHFYRDVIGLKMLPHHAERVVFDLGGAYLMLLKGRATPAQDMLPARFPLVAFSVENLDRAVERLHTHQVETPCGIESGPGNRWVMFHDPAGNLVELVEFTQVA